MQYFLPLIASLDISPVSIFMLLQSKICEMIISRFTLMVMVMFLQRSTCLTFIAIFTLIYSSFAEAVLPGYENETVQFLSFIVETQHQKTSTKGIHSQQTFWQEVFLDLKTSQGVSRVLYTENKPKDFTQPDLIILLSGIQATQIDHKNKKVLIDDLMAKHQDGSSFLYAGRIHLGVVLKAAIQSNLKSPIANQQNLHIGAPYFKNSIEITLDDDQHVIALEDAERSYQFHWSFIDNGKFEYVNSLHVTYDFGFQRVKINELVHECKLYPELPARFFQYEWPNDYAVEDLRKKSSPPLTLSN